MSKAGHLSVQQGKKVLVVMEDGHHIIARHYSSIYELLMHLCNKVLK